VHQFLLWKRLVLEKEARNHRQLQKQFFIAQQDITTYVHAKVMKECPLAKVKKALNALRELLSCLDRIALNDTVGDNHTASFSFIFVKDTL
jgi:hypothetical protein